MCGIADYYLSVMRFLRTFIMLTLLSGSLAGQGLDTRAELDVEGRVAGINVAPNGKLWLVSATGHSYYAERIDSNWHYGPTIFSGKNGKPWDDPTFDRVSFFNQDTAFISGYISVVHGDLVKNGIYVTSNGGRDWRVVDFGGNDWIYDAFVDRSGRAWMGGSSGDIYFSGNFGDAWTKLNSPFNSSTRMHKIFMANSNDGVAGALHNQIYITHDNWQTSQQIVTPEDQRKIDVDDLTGERIESVALWNSRVIVSQGGRVFNSGLDNIMWEPFPFSVSDFHVDAESRMLYCVLTNKHVIQVDSNMRPTYLTKDPLPAMPWSIQVVKDEVFLLDEAFAIIKLKKDGFTRAAFYTTDRKIAEPALIGNGPLLTWGLNGNQLYMSRNHGVDWFRLEEFGRRFHDLLVLTDSLVVLWDGNDNYTYSLHDPLLRPYVHTNPLSDFLKGKLVSVQIDAGSRGCFHNEGNIISYRVKNDTTLSSMEAVSSSYDDRHQSLFRNEVSLVSLEKILRTVDLYAGQGPTIDKFNITDSDKNQYLKLVRKRAQHRGYDGYAAFKKNETIYKSMPSLLDTLSATSIKKALDRGERFWSTTSYWFNVDFVNAEGDTLSATRYYFESNKPWNLPWRFLYKGRHFNSYEVALSRFIDTCVPKDFIGKQIFSNSNFLMELADYLVEERRTRY